MMGARNGKGSSGRIRCASLFVFLLVLSFAAAAVCHAAASPDRAAYEESNPSPAQLGLTGESRISSNPEEAEAPKVSHEPVETEFFVRVAVRGRDWADGDSFEVGVEGLSASDEAGNAIDLPMPEKQTVIQDKYERISFGPVTYTQSGVYVYAVAQTPGTATDLIYDSAPHTVVVTVREDSGDGRLVADVSYEMGSKSQQIINRYRRPATGTAEIRVRKFLAGRDWESGDSFSFRLSAEEGVPMPEGADEQGVKIKVTDRETASFGEIRYTSPGEYVYTVNETIPKDAVDNGDGTFTKEGITYDAAKHRVVVTMTDDQEGHLLPSVSFDGEISDCLIVTNSYDATDSRQIYVAGSIIGREWQEGDAFTFDLEGGSSTNGQGEAVVTPLPDQTTLTVAGGEPASFGAIRFSEPGVYTYRITQRRGHLKGMLYDVEPHTVMIAVTDRDGSGKLRATISYDGGGTAQKISNLYTPADLTGSGEIFVHPRIQGRGWRKDDSFTFRIIASNSDSAAGDPVSTPMPENETVTVTQGERASFGTILFPEPGVYRYKIGQAVPSDAADNGDGTYTRGGMTYDASAHPVTVTVENNGNEKLDVAISYDSGADAAEIVNTYVSRGPIPPEILEDPRIIFAIPVLIAVVAIAGFMFHLSHERKKRRRRRR